MTLVHGTVVGHSQLNGSFIDMAVGGHDVTISTLPSTGQWTESDHYR